MEEFQFSRSFDLRKMCNEVYVFMKALTMKKFSYSHIKNSHMASENFTTLDKTLVRTFS